MTGLTNFEILLLDGILYEKVFYRFLVLLMDTITADIEEQQAFGLREKIAAYLELTKPRIAFMLLLTAAAGFYLGTNGTFDTYLFVSAMIAILLLAPSGIFIRAGRRV